jgi:hypothetical protein
MALGGGVAALGLVVAALGGLIAVWSYADYDMTAPRWVAVGLGAGLAVIAARFALSIANTLIGGARAHQQRVAEWHAVAMAAWEAQQGQEVEQQLTEWSWSPSNARDVLLAGLMVHWQVRQGADRPWSERKLTGEHYLSNGQHMELVGELSQVDAGRMAERFVALGWVAGRGDRSAGQWNVQSADELLASVVRSLR